MAIEKITDSTYHDFIHTPGTPVLVVFSAPWCGDCRRIAPALKQAAEEYAGQMLFGQVERDEEMALAQAQQVRRIPTFMIYRDGEMLGALVEPESKAVLDDFIAKALARPRKGNRLPEQIHDMVVVGGGPGGYTAALYAARAGFDTVVVEKMSAGGQMALTHQIDNYPGFEEGVDGFTLGDKMRQGAERFGVQTLMTEVTALELGGDIKRVETADGPLHARTVVIATGASPRALGVAREQEMTGRGVSYCAACDGMFFKGKTVVIVGGGNSAAADAMVLSRLCEKVILVHRRDTLRATRVYHEPLKAAKNISFRWNSVVTGLLGDETITGVRLRDVQSGEETQIDCAGVFVSVGRKPSSELVKGQLGLDANGYIVADESTRTAIPGVYAVGDVRTKELRQVVTAVADGAMAVHHAEEYLALSGN